jgi:cholesterol transport system auxiliary component
MIRQAAFPLPRLVATALLLTLLGSCSMLGGTEESPPAFYSLSGSGPVPPVTASPAVRSSRAPTLIVNPPRAAPGFDSQHIIYVREPYRLEYFAHSEWIDTPARMIAPRIVAALEGTGAFRAVVLAPSAAVGELRLDIEIIRLQHEFDRSPSQLLRRRGGELATGGRDAPLNRRGAKARQEKRQAREEGLHWDRWAR